MLALITYIAIAIMVSFMCSLLEAMILSITPSQIGLLEKQGMKAAERLARYKDNIDRPLSSILTVNTAANMVGAAGVGAEVSKLFGSDALALASGLLTLGILIFSEIIPKTLGARYAIYIAPFGAHIISFLCIITYPFIIMAEKITYILPQPAEEKDQAKDELIVTAELSHNKGNLEEKESTILKNLLTLDRLSVVDIMTNRSKVLGYQKDITATQILHEDQNIRYSRLPVYGEDFDDIVGVVHRYKLLEAEWAGEGHKKLEALCSEVYFVSQNLSVANALKQFIKTKQHLFIVINSYGATSGLLTLEDTIECLIGEQIVDEYDLVDEDKHLEIIQKDTNKFVIKSRDKK